MTQSEQDLAHQAFETLKVNGKNIAHRKIEGATPGVVFAHGLMSDMNGTKASALSSYCEKSGIAYVRFDCRGHGASSGKFEDHCISDWAEDLGDVLDHLTEGPQIIVGSSMGGWLMLLAALQKPEKVHGLVGIAAAPDFTLELENDLLSPPRLKELREEGVTHLPSEYGEPYPITQKLLDDGRTNAVNNRLGSITVPVCLLHGQKDTIVPCENSVRLAEKLGSKSVAVNLIEGGDHSLSRPEDIAALYQTINRLHQNR